MNTFTRNKEERKKEMKNMKNKGSTGIGLKKAEFQVPALPLK